MSKAHLVDLSVLDAGQRFDLAQVLVAAFAADYPEAWPTVESALEELDILEHEGAAALVAFDSVGLPVGFIGALPMYDGNVWEVHPLAVRPDSQRQGVGARLMAALESRAAQSGVSTLYVASDDEAGTTSLGGVDVYPDPLAHLMALENRRGHPFTFYRKQGFVLVGVIPDANGFGKPDILMAKRVARRA
ncbi:MAG: GNAT family N-acetyltransferase [Anaerolineae bacterium]|jgi:aminoglycoside 6'-N-acetyltransferase I|nr:GNAT family N-acetyltransferase [Anaerolineae bacterium]